MPENPIHRYSAAQLEADRDLARILEQAAQSIQDRIRGLPQGIGGRVRAAQLKLVLREIRDIQHELWLEGVTRNITTGRRAAARAAEEAAELLQAVAYTSLPDDVAEALTRGFRATARAGIEASLSRTPRELSDRVWKNYSVMSKTIEDMIRVGLMEGLSAKELAKSVYRFASPTAPGGQSHAAMRLARTEINNAFHDQQIKAGNRPGVLGIKWNLSSSHPKPDDCDKFAKEDAYDQGQGVFPQGDVPKKPHPHCFCYLTYKMMTPRQFKNNLAAGVFDDDLNARIRANLRELGFPK